METEKNHYSRETAFRKTLTYYTLASFNFISLLIFLGYGICNLFMRRFIIGSFELLVAFILSGTLYFVLIKKSVAAPGTVNIVAFQIMAVYLFISGGAANSGIFWSFLFPITYFFLKGGRTGLIWFLIQFIAMTTVFIFSKLDYLSIPYSDNHFMVFSMVLITEAVILYIHEKITDENLVHIKELRGLLPICTECKKIRDDKGYWNILEAYIKDRSYAEFTHSICPDCMKKLYPEFIDELP